MQLTLQQKRFKLLFCFVLSAELFLRILKIDKSWIIYWFQCEANSYVLETDGVSSSLQAMGENPNSISSLF